MSHTLHKSLPARVWALLAALLIAGGIIAMAPSPAHAHDELLGSDPAADATLDALPAQLALTFSAEIADDAGASVVEVTDDAGASLVDGAPTVQDNVLTQPLAGETSGTVKVLWKVVSSDGHPISGEFSFTVTGTPTPTPTETATPAPTETVTPMPTATATVAPTPSEEADSTFGDVWPWVIGAILLAGVAGAVLYLLVSRARREKALADGPGGAPADPSRPGSEPPADH